MKIFRYYDIKEKKEFESFLERAGTGGKNVLDIVQTIINVVRSEGDKGLFAYSRKFDNFAATKSNIRVKEKEITAAFSSIPGNIINALKTAKKNIEGYHKKQLSGSFTYKTDYGRLALRALPVESAGIYIPGGKAAYPSSVLMNVIPARIAGVPRLVICTPAVNGKIKPVILAAAKICGVTEIYKIGGAQAIAALAYGTESVQPVVKITGPGNAYVAAAKQLVYGKAGIDSIAGPSEVLIVADQGNNPEYVAADMLAQAEHDEDNRCILVTDSMIFAGKVLMFLSLQKDLLARKKIILKSLDNSFIVVVKSLKDAVAVSNKIAPEHLELFAKKAIKESKLYTNAGAVFIGENSPVAAGDYIAGTNHVLPTVGAAKFSSPLGVYDFMKFQSTVEITKNGLAGLKAKLKLLALAEGLDGHARSAEIRNTDA